MKSRVLKVIAGIAVSLVLAVLASSYFLVKILMCGCGRDFETLFIERPAEALMICTP